MKKSYIILATLLFLSCLYAMAGGKDYKIEGLYKAEGVTINGNHVKVGDSFYKKDRIEWGNNDEAAIKVMEIATSKTYVFSKRQFDSKGKVMTVAEFFLRTNMTSTRETGDEAVVNIKRCSDRFSFNERRIALVIGNTAYTSLPSLQNPQSDAIAVTDKLLTLGFDVVETFDCNIAEFRSILSQFEQIADDYQLVLFYYAGHGIQKDGKNYLVPVTERLQKPDDINNCVACEDVLRSLEKTACSSRIVFFDACRSFNSALSDGSHKGLAQIQQLAPGTIVVYSTGYGQVASDGEGNHSPFAQALLSKIGTPSVSFELEIKEVASETWRLTAQRQYPALSGSLTENIVLNPRKRSEPSPTGKESNTTPPLIPNEKAQTLVSQGKQASKSFDYSQAFRCFQEAANMGDMEGYYQLGLLYHNDNFESASLEKAIQCLTIAANLGHTEAMFQLGLIYQGRDNALAKQWLKKAADRGHAKAADRLSRMR